MMCWCTVSDFSSFILLFCTLATVYFCFFLFCLFVCFVYGRGRGLHAALVGVAPLFQVWGAKIQMFFSDWEGCGVTNDINERLMQTHINLVFFIPFPNTNFFQDCLVIWENNAWRHTWLAKYYDTFYQVMKQSLTNLGVFWSKYWGWEKN